MVEKSSHSIRSKVATWSLVFDSLNQDAFNSVLTFNGAEQLNQNFDIQSENFGRDIAVAFDQPTNTWSITRLHLESDLIYFCATDDCLVISNDLVQMRSLTNAHELNKRWMLNFFSFTDDFSDESPIKGILILPALGQISIASHGHEIKRQSISARQGTQGWSTEKWVKEWRTNNRKAVSESCKDSESVAIMLSSGLDSGGIAAYLVDQRKKDGVPQNIKGFSWRFPGHSEADESQYIQSLVEYLGLDHEFIDIEDAECFTDISAWPVSLDAPYFNAMRRIKKKLYEEVASKGFNILLNGHIGDELCFVDRYVLNELWRDNKLAWLKEFSCICMQKGLNIRHDSSFRYWLKQRLNKSDKTLPPPLSLTDTAKNNYQKNGLGNNTFSNKRAEQIGLLTANSELSAIATERTFTDEYAIDRCHPYLNQQLISLALTCPAYLLSTHQQTKWISRQALSGLLPQKLINRPRVGQLDELFEQGLEKNREEVKEYLFRSERRWPEFIKEDVVLDILEQKQWDQAASILVPCLGFERWMDEWKALGMPIV